MSDGPTAHGLSSLRSETTGFLAGGGEMGALMRSLNWSKTAVGPVATWPQSLRTALSILLDSGYPMYIAWGRDFTQFYNDAYRPILGEKKHPAAMGQSSRECFAEIWDFIGPMFERVLREGQNTTLTDQLLGLDRFGYVEECYFTFSYSAIRDESGGVGGVLVTVIETTDRVLEERRQKTLSRLTTEFLEASDAEKVLQTASEVLAANSFDLPFAGLYGADDSKIWPFDAVSREKRPLHLRELTPAQRAFQGTAWPEPVTEAFIAPIFDAGHERVSCFLVTGINPRHRLDPRYTWFLETVAEQIGSGLVKVRAYEEERARAAALAELDRAKTAFFSNVSHEFRTPLTLMLGPLEEMISMGGDLPERAGHLADVTYRNALRLQKLVNTLLDFSRIEAGRVQASYEPVDLCALTTEIASTFRSAMERAGLGFHVECEPLPGPVYIDREMWEKVVLNLLSNALKYTFRGSVTVKLEEKNGLAELSVRDTGTGIPQHELAKLFDRFHRVEGARGRTQEGTGIGLALVSELIRMHGGTIVAESQVEAGSTFRVSIPFGKDHLPQERVVPAAGPKVESAAAMLVDEASRWIPSRPEHTSRSAASRGRVLVADDNADMRDYLVRLLSGAYEVQAVANGIEALSSVRAHSPDLVLSDVMMPGMDGFSLLQALRGNPDTARLPVILLSARAGEEARVEGLDAGATDYLVKPFTARELLARVGAHVDMARASASAAERESALRAEAQAERDRAVGILESISDGFFALDENWCFTYVNPAGEKLLQHTQEELLGKNHWDMYPEAVGSIGHREYHRAVREQVAVSFEIFYDPFDRWYSVNAYPDKRGGLSVFLNDVTESKRSSLTLQHQWQSFDTALSHTPDHIYTFDRDCRFTYANKAVLELWQRPLDQLIGMNFTDLGMPVETSRPLTGHIQHVIRTRELVTDTTEVTGARGDTRKYEYIFVPIIDDRGEVEGVAGSTRDITDSDLAQKSLAASEERLQQILAQAPVAIVVLRGSDFVVELANPPYQALLPGRELVGRSLREVVPELGQNVWEIFTRVMETGEAFVADEFEVPYDSDRDGVVEEHWFNVVYNPRREADGTVSGIIAVLTDVTAQVRARQELERVNKELEEFAYVASHDLQEPLRMVNIYTELLVKRHVRQEDPDAVGYAAFIHKGVNRMVVLVRDLLSYSRSLHSGHLSERENTAELEDAWKEAVNVMQVRIAETGALIRATALPAVQGETGQLALVFQNLLSNALKYSKPDVPPEIRVRAERHGERWVIAVQDNGIGFEQQYAEGIFGLFKRLYRDEYPGTGLGLAISQRIVQRYGGKIWAESQPGVGSTFFIELPSPSPG